MNTDDFVFDTFGSHETERARILAKHPEIENFTLDFYKKHVAELIATKYAPYLSKAPVDMYGVVAEQKIEVRKREQLIGPQANMLQRVIWLKQSTPEKNQRMNLGHELVHFFLIVYDSIHHAGVRDAFPELSSDETEYVCDRITEFFVVPDHLLHKHVTDAISNGSIDVEKLAQIFDVSKEIITRRMNDLGIQLGQTYFPF